VRVTHPFHPLFGQELQVVQPHRRGHPDRVFFYDDRGQLRSLPIRWTSAEPDDPFIILAAGRSPLRVAELRELAALVRRWRP
jgi:hypothetical protein